MSDRSYPTDAIGNPIKEGDCVMIELTQRCLVTQVLKVEPAGNITSPNGQPMQMTGTLYLQAVIPIKFSSGQNAVESAYAVKMPETLPAGKLVTQ